MDNYQSCNYKSFSLNNSEWNKISIICIPQNSNNVSFRFVIDSIDSSEELLIDDVEITEDGVNYSPPFTFAGDLTSRVEQLQWAKDNQIKILLIISYMPEWLADTNFEGCDLNKLNRCSPKNYSLLACLVHD